MLPSLRLYEEVLANAAEVSLPPAPRLLFVAHGSIAIGDRLLRDDEGFGSEGAARLKAGAYGATVWRWELALGDAGDVVGAAGILSREKLSAPLETLPMGALLLRGDSVAFPAGGCLFAPASGTGHPLPDRGRNPHRRPRPLDLVRTWHRWV